MASKIVGNTYASHIARFSANLQEEASNLREGSFRAVAPEQAQQIFQNRSFSFTLRGRPAGVKGPAMMGHIERLIHVRSK